MASAAILIDIKGMSHGHMYPPSTESWRSTISKSPHLKLYLLDDRLFLDDDFETSL